MSRIRLVISEALGSLTSNLSTTVAATLTVLIGMFLVGFLVGFASWARSWSNEKKGELVVKVFYCTDATCPHAATPKQINHVASMLESNSLVKSVKFVSKEEALQIMKKRHPELVAAVPSNPLPDAEEVHPVQGEYTERIADSLRRNLPPGVQKVDYGKKTARKIVDISRLIEVIFSIAIVILLIASTVLIANTIRLSIFARRREIEVMKLVGASNWFVRGPYMVEGLVCGLIGSVAAVVLLVLGKEVALPAINWPDDPGVNAIAFELNGLIVIGVGLVVGAVGSGLTLRRFLRV
jgi:cell division transport system permease protein